jgi:hypothetical protein
VFAWASTLGFDVLEHADLAVAVENVCSETKPKM